MARGGGGNDVTGGYSMVVRKGWETPTKKKQATGWPLLGAGLHEDGVRAQPEGGGGAIARGGEGHGEERLLDLKEGTVGKCCKSLNAVLRVRV